MNNILIQVNYNNAAVKLPLSNLKPDVKYINNYEESLYQISINPNISYKGLCFLDLVLIKENEPNEIEEIHYDSLMLTNEDEYNLSLNFEPNQMILKISGYYLIDKYIKKFEDINVYLSEYTLCAETLYCSENTIINDIETEE